MHLTRCTEEEFDAFIAAYPRTLEKNVFWAIDPSFVTYNDFAVAPHRPDSVVAAHYLPDDRDLDPDHRWRIGEMPEDEE